MINERCGCFIDLVQKCVLFFPFLPIRHEQNCISCVLYLFFVVVDKSIKYDKMLNWRTIIIKQQIKFFMDVFSSLSLGSRFALTANWNECNYCVIWSDNNLLWTVRRNLSNSFAWLSHLIHLFSLYFLVCICFCLLHHSLALNISVYLCWK